MNSNHLDKDQNTYDVFKNEETGSIQFRFYLEDDDPQIFNKRLILNKGYFTDPFFLSYQKKFNRNGKLVYETYYNDVLQMYAEIKDTPECRIDQHFSNDGIIFMELKYFKDKNGKPTTIEENHFDSNGVRIDHKSYPCSEVYDNLIL